MHSSWQYDQANRILICCLLQIWHKGNVSLKPTFCLSPNPWVIPCPMHFTRTNNNCVPITRCSESLSRLSVHQYAPDPSFSLCLKASQEKENSQRQIRIGKVAKRDGVAPGARSATRVAGSDYNFFIHPMTRGPRAVVPPPKPQIAPTTLDCEDYNGQSRG